MFNKIGYIENKFESNTLKKLVLIQAPLTFVNFSNI